MNRIDATRSGAILGLVTCVHFVVLTVGKATVRFSCIGLRPFFFSFPFYFIFFIIFIGFFFIGQSS